MTRSYVQPANERTLIPIIAQPGLTHIDLGFTLLFDTSHETVVFSGQCCSILMDALIKMTGSPKVRLAATKIIPYFQSNLDRLIAFRYLRLCCLTEGYKTLWDECYPYLDYSDSWAITPQAIGNDIPLVTVANFSRITGLRNDYLRRLAMIEIDVLVAIKFKVSIDELIQLYLVQFPVMKAYEQADQYDTKGRRLPNTTRKDAGAKELRDALQDHDGQSPVTVTWPIDNGNQTVTRTFYPPFRHVDRIEDYRTAYRVMKDRI
jgi:hypothetical protein